MQLTKLIALAGLAVFVAAAPAESPHHATEAASLGLSNSTTNAQQGDTLVHGNVHMEFGGPFAHWGPLVHRPKGGDWTFDKARFESVIFQKLCPEDWVNRPEPCMPANRGEIIGEEHGMWNTDKNGKWTRGEAWLEVEAADFDGNLGVRKALVELVAGTMLNQAITEGNCYKVNNEKGVGDTMCNIATKYFSRVSGGAGVSGFLDVTYHFSDPADPGPYDRAGTMPFILTFMETEIAPQLAKAFNLPFFDSFVDWQ